MVSSLSIPRKRRHTLPSASGKHVNFYQKWFYVFNPEGSGPGLNPTDMMNTVNLVAAGLKSMLEPVSDSNPSYKPQPYATLLDHSTVGALADASTSDNGRLGINIC